MSSAELTAGPSCSAGPGSSPACFPLLNSTEAAALAWLRYLLSLSDGGPYAGRWALLTWWSDSDFLPEDVEAGCYTKPCAEYGPSTSRDNFYCSVVGAYRSLRTPAWSGEALLKMFGTMGIRAHDGLALKPNLGALWRSRCASCS